MLGIDSTIRIHSADNPGWSRDYPAVNFRPTLTLPDANLRYQDALDWRKWTKADKISPFVRAVLKSCHEHFN